MRQIRKRLTYANVMSSIAVFLLIGGGAAFAATQLPKNSVGTKQLKKNAVTAAKVKKNAVTTAKIKNGAVTTAKLSNGAVTGAKIAASAVTTEQIKDNAVTGAKVDESTLGTVPSAANVNGVVLTKFRATSAGGTPETEVYNDSHLRVTFACNGAGEITVNAYTLSDHASLNSYGTSTDTQDDDFNIADNPATISASDEQRDVVYSDASGYTVHLSYLAEENRPSGPQCVLAGFAESA